MTLDYDERGKVKVSMVEDINQILIDYPESIGKIAFMPVTDYLFQVRDESETWKLEKQWTITYGHVVAQFLFLSGQVPHC